jgi:transcriptional regulator with XRE-family HTH domain
MTNKQQLARTIKSLRDEKQVSQEMLAKYVGISRPALSAIETGNRGVDTFELLKIAGYFNIKVDELLSRNLKETNVKLQSTDVNKDIEFRKEKARDVLLYVLEKCGGKPNFGETVFYKLLYFIDFDAYEQLGKPITKMNYVKLQFGPVPQAAQFDLIVQEMKESKQIKTFVQEYHGMKQKRYIALADADLGSLSIKEKDIIDDVINRLSDLSATQIEAYSHGDVPWLATNNQEIISYDLVFDREAPYSQRDYNQIWQDSAGEDTLKVLGSISKKEQDYYDNL